MMAILIAVAVALGLFILGDHICYWRRLDTFENLASDFSSMYNSLTPKVINPNNDDSSEYEYQGTYFRAVVRKGDIKSLYLQMRLAISSVLDAYDKIGERYLSLMDEETSERIYYLHQTVEEIAHIIRYQCWLKGIK